METTKNTKKRNKNVYKKKNRAEKEKKSRNFVPPTISMEYVVFFYPNVVKDWKHKELKTDLKKQATHARKKRKRSTPSVSKYKMF
jgi:hypothetical protein